MYKHKKRTGYIFPIEDGEASITILKPLSGELTHNGQYLVIYEDAHGITELLLMKLSEIAYTYGIDQRDLEDV
jgi:hypothetical protein